MDLLFCFFVEFLTFFDNHFSIGIQDNTLSLIPVYLMLHQIKLFPVDDDGVCCNPVPFFSVNLIILSLHSDQCARCIDTNESGQILWIVLIYIVAVDFSIPVQYKYVTDFALLFHSFPDVSDFFFFLHFMNRDYSVIFDSNRHILLSCFLIWQMPQCFSCCLLIYSVDCKLIKLHRHRPPSYSDNNSDPENSSICLRSAVIFQL